MALVRFGGGSRGIKEYLQTGKKQGREKSRDDLDKRIGLEGDLDICDKIINSRETDGERYDHITLSFKEKDISEETLKAITADFKAFALAAYGENELYLYAEAHIPRTATEEKWNSKTKSYETVGRHPHIHFVIPKTNLITGEYTSAFELLRAKYATKDATMDIADAFQEHINDKYGLASPKDNRRADFTGEADILSRIKEDDFGGRNNEKLKMIRERMLDEKIESPQAFRDMLKTMGKVSIGRRGQRDQYYQIKLPGETQNVRLDYDQFRNPFLALPMGEKLAVYENRLTRAAIEQKVLQAQVYAELLVKWPDRAREIKYLSPSSKFFKEYYAKATDAEKQFVLDKLEAEHYTKLEKEHGYVRPAAEGTMERQVAAGLEHDGRGHAGQVDASAAITRNLAESSRNFAALGVDPDLNADAVREYVSGVAEATLASEYASGIRGRTSEHDGHGIDRPESGGLGHGDQRETNARAVGDNLRTADANHRISDGLSREFWEAAIANRASLDNDATARRLEAYGNGRLNSIYLRTTDELREADTAGQQIIAEPGNIIFALTWSESTFNEKKLEQHLLKNTVDQEQFDAALKAVLAHQDLVVKHDEKCGLLFTSKEIVAIEISLVACTKRMAADRSAHRLERDLQPIVEAKKFNEGQRAAFELLCSDKRLVAVNGAAGTGKSYVLLAMRQAYQREGFRVLGGILQGKTAEDLQRDSGIECRTIARMLIDIKNGTLHLDDKTVLVVDEAGMVGSRDLEKLLAHAEQYGARVRLVGDAKQIAAVEYGNAFVEISKLTEVASLTQIMRQETEWMQQASEKFAVHDIDALKDYYDHDHVHIADTLKDAQIEIVGMWNADRAEHPEQSRIVLSHTNAARIALNGMMRAELKKEGQLHNEIDVITTDGIIKMAVGEQVMFTAPGNKMDVRNGTTGTILEISKDGAITVALAGDKTAKFYADGRGTQDGNAVDYGYAVTIHKSQGMTVDKAYLLAENSMTLELLYVAMTRHRQNVELVASAEQFATIDNLLRGLDRTGNKAFSVEDGKEWLSAERLEDSVIGQMLADLNAEKVIMLAAEQAPYKEIAANLDAQRVLDHVSKTHGIDTDLHEVITDDKGRQRIQANQIVKDDQGRERIEAVGGGLDLAGFLTKRMHLDYKTQAAPMLRQLYGEQVAQVYSTKRDKEIDQVMKAEFADHRKLRDAQYKLDKDRLDTEKRTEKAAILLSVGTVGEHKLDVAELSQRIKTAKTTLLTAHHKPEAEVYREWVAERAMFSEKHLKELWRVAVTPEDKARLAEIETNLAAVRERAKADFYAATSDIAIQVLKANDEAAKIALVAEADRSAELVTEAARVAKETEAAKAAKQDKEQDYDNER